jgi:hypothetical protein
MPRDHILFIMRTTVDIDEPLMRDLKQLQKETHQPLGRLISSLIAQALAQRRVGDLASPEELRWISQPMHSRVDLEDKEALWRELDRF